MKILWVDLETTGTDPKLNGIIQAAFIVEVDGQVKEERVFFMNPSKSEINPAALAVNRVTEDIIREYPDETIVKVEIENMLEKYVDRYDSDDKFIAAGYNVGFDLDFLRALWARVGDVYFMSWVDAVRIDIMHVQGFLEWSGKTTKTKSRKLLGLGDHYNAVNSNTHDAGDDIRLTREIGLKMIELTGGNK